MKKITMRSLHRDLGFLVLGITIIYSLSGILLVFRDTNLLKREVTVERKLQPNLNNEQLAREFRSREFKLLEVKNDVMYFPNGTYNVSTGLAVIKTTDLIPPFNKFVRLHKADSWVMSIFGLILLFLAVSSFWMFKPRTKYFKTGLLYTGIGILISIVILIIL